MANIDIESDKTSLGNDQTTYSPNIFTYSFAQKLLSASFLIGLCNSCLLKKTNMYLT